MRFVAVLVLVLPTLLQAQSSASTMAEAGSLMKKGDYAGAATAYRAITTAAPQNAQAWHYLGYSLHAQGELDAALKAHLKAASFPATKAKGLYNAACVYSLKDEEDLAIRHLKRAVAAGFRDRALLASDTDLENVREDPRFEQLLPPLLTGADAFTEKPRVLYTLDGEAANDQYGWVARIVGDVDGDGAIDFAATAPTHTTGGRSAGRIYVHSGRSGKLLFKHDGSPGARLGNSVAAAGDVNGDGVPDVVAGAPGHPKKAGAAFVYSGKDGKKLMELTANEVGDSFGMKVAGDVDLDGDGRADILVGASGCDAAAQNAGRLYAYSGKDGKLLFTVDGRGQGENLGVACDATRLPDGGHIIIVGAMNAGPGNRGRAYVYRHRAGEMKPFFTIEADATGVNLGQYFVSIIGDVDADGTPDVYASDFSNTANGKHSGRIYVHSGKDGKRLLELTGKTGEGFGTSPSAAGDVDGDGHDDLIIGAWQNAEGAPSGGKCYLHSGKDGAVLATYTCRQAQDTFGFDAVGVGDLDGDGAIDFLLTSAWSDVAGFRSGRVFVIAGHIGRKAGDNR